MINEEIKHSEFMSDNDIVFELMQYLKFMRERRYGSISDEQHTRFLLKLSPLLKETNHE